MKLFIIFCIYHFITSYQYIYIDYFPSSNSNCTGEFHERHIFVQDYCYSYVFQPRIWYERASLQGNMFVHSVNGEYNTGSEEEFLYGCRNLLKGYSDLWESFPMHGCVKNSNGYNLVRGVDSLGKIVAGININDGDQVRINYVNPNCGGEITSAKIIRAPGQNFIRTQYCGGATSGVSVCEEYDNFSMTYTERFVCGSTVDWVGFGNGEDPDVNLKSTTCSDYIPGSNDNIGLTIFFATGFFVVLTVLIIVIVIMGILLITMCKKENGNYVFLNKLNQK